MSYNWAAITAIAEATMAIATFALIFFTWRENRQARAFSQLREKLFFYSELLAGMPRSHKAKIDDPEKIDYQTKYEFYNFLKDNISIGRRYTVLAEPELMERLHHIITGVRDFESSIYDSVEARVGEAIVIVHRDFTKLKQEYYDC